MTREPTVETIKEGLTKLLREVKQLQTEVRGLTARLGKFTDEHPIPPPDTVGFDWVQRPATRPPRQEFKELMWELKSTDNLEVPTRALFAILKDLDSALRDIRGARADIDAISNNADLRDDFKHWLKDQ